MKIYIVKAFREDYTVDEGDYRDETTYLQMGAYVKFDSAVNAVKDYVINRLKYGTKGTNRFIYTPDEIAIAAKVCINNHVRFIETERGNEEVMIEELEVNEE